MQGMTEWWKLPYDDKIEQRPAHPDPLSRHQLPTFMSGLVFPIFIALAAFFAVIYTYSTIKRGGSKVYTLERESILRRATAMLWL